MAANTLLATLALKDQMTKRLKKVGDATRRVARGMKRAFTSVRRSVLNLRNAVAVLLVAAAAKMAAEFESSLSKIVGLVGLAREAVEGFRESIFKIGVETGVGPRALAEALFDITSAGFRGAQAMDVLRVSAQAAASGLGEAKDVAGALTSAVIAFRGQNLSAAAATDVLVATVREGKLAAADLAPQLGRLLGPAAELGISFNEVGAAMAFLSLTSGDASLSATELAGVMQRLLKPTSQGVEALQRAGISVSELQRRVKEGGLIVTLQQLRKELEANGQELGKVFEDSRAFNAVLKITGDQSEIALEKLNSLKNATGSLARAFSEARTTTRVTFGQMRAAFDQLAITFGDLVKAVGEAGVFEFLKEIFVEVSQVIVRLGKDMGGTREASELFVEIFKVVGFVVAGAIEVFRKASIPVAALGRAFLQSALAIIDLQFGLEKMKAKLTGNTTAHTALSIAQGVLTTNIKTQIVALEEVIFKTIEQRTALEVFGDIVDRVEGKLKRQREEQERSATAAREHQAALRELAEMFGGELVQEADGFQTSMTFLRANISKLSDEMQEFVFEGGGASEMIRRFNQEFGKLGPQSDSAAKGVETFADQVREALEQLAKGPQTVDEFTDALSEMPNINRAFVLGGEGVEEMNSRLKQTQRELKATEDRAKVVANAIQQFSGAVADFVGRVLDKAFEGQIKTMKDVGKIAQDVLKSLLKSVIQQLVQLAVQAAVTRAIAGAATGAIVEGGVVGSTGGSVPAFAAGGVIQGPGLFIAGEGGNNEAIVPLPDGRSIPVMMQGGEGGGGSSVTNNFTVQAIDEAGVNAFFARRETQDALKGGVVNGMNTDSAFRKNINGSMGA